MLFHEKVRRRVQDLGLNKAKAARDAGLPESTISNYMSKVGSLPRIDIAQKIAVALKVPLEWLANDELDWPPPAIDSHSIVNVPDHELMAEACRRLINQASKAAAILHQIIEQPWPELALEIGSVPVDEPLPEKFNSVMRWLYLLESLRPMLDEFDASKNLYLYAANPPKIDDIREQIAATIKDNGYIAAALKFRELRELAEALKRHGGSSKDRDLDGHRLRVLAIIAPATQRQSRR